MKEVKWLGSTTVVLDGADLIVGYYHEGIVCEWTGNGYRAQSRFDVSDYGWQWEESRYTFNGNNVLCYKDKK